MYCDADIHAILTYSVYQPMIPLTQAGKSVYVWTLHQEESCRYRQCLFRGISCAPSGLVIYSGNVPRGRNLCRHEPAVMAKGGKFSRKTGL